MNIFRSPELKISIIVQIILEVVGIAVCISLDRICAVVLAIVFTASLAVQCLFLAKRQNTISGFCDEIDKLLHGAEKINLESFQEGELSILSSEIQKMTVRLREQNSALRREKVFLKESLEDISHQLRTPLTTMLVILGMLREPKLPAEERSEHVREMMSLLSRMSWLIDTMLGLSRLEADAVKFKPENIFVSELVRDSFEPLSISFELKDITLKTEINENIHIFADKQYLSEALVNIFKNCLEHSQSGGEVTVSAYENGIFTDIVITDTGTGISDEEISKIFERYYRGSDLSGKGYGIGLAFARKIAASQNGSLVVRNRKDRSGAEFELRMYKSPKELVRDQEAGRNI